MSLEWASRFWLKPMTDDPSSPSEKLGRNRAVTNSEQVSRTRKKLVRECMTYDGVFRASFSYEFLGRRTWVVCHGL